jgi:hypothetical protein
MYGIKIRVYGTACTLPQGFPYSLSSHIIQHGKMQVSVSYSKQAFLWKWLQLIMETLLLATLVLPQCMLCSISALRYHNLTQHHHDFILWTDWTKHLNFEPSHTTQERRKKPYATGLFLSSFSWGVGRTYWNLPWVQKWIIPASVKKGIPERQQFLSLALSTPVTMGGYFKCTHIFLTTNSKSAEKQLKARFKTQIQNA